MDMLNCTNHPDKPVQGVCHSCGKPYCRECLVEDDDYYYCKAEGCLPQGFVPKDNKRKEPRSGPGFAVRALGVPWIVCGILILAFVPADTPPGVSPSHAQMVGGTIAIGVALMSAEAWAWYVEVLLVLGIGMLVVQRGDQQAASFFALLGLCVLTLLVAFLNAPWKWAKPQPDLGPVTVERTKAEKAREERDELRLRAETKELLDKAEKEGGKVRAEPEGARIRRRRDSL